MRPLFGKIFCVSRETNGCRLPAVFRESSGFRGNCLQLAAVWVFREVTCFDQGVFPGGSIADCCLAFTEEAVSGGEEVVADSADRLVPISSLNVKATICLRQSPPDFLTQHKTTICRRQAQHDPLIQRKNSDWIKVKNFCAMFGKCDSVSLNENALKTITPFPSDRRFQSTTSER